jgi:gamma-glutamyl phosphate reductase
VCGIDGVCHVFVDKAADINKAKCIVVDSKTDYPAACNAMVGALGDKPNLLTVDQVVRCPVRSSAGEGRVRKRELHTSL